MLYPLNPCNSHYNGVISGYTVHTQCHLLPLQNHLPCTVPWQSEFLQTANYFPFFFKPPPPQHLPLPPNWRGFATIRMWTLQKSMISQEIYHPCKLAKRCIITVDLMHMTFLGVSPLCLSPTASKSHCVAGPLCPSPTVYQAHCVPVPLCIRPTVSQSHCVSVLLRPSPTV